MKEGVLAIRPVGYTYLIAKLQLDRTPHWHTSSVSTVGSHRTKVQDGCIEEIYPLSYWPGDRITDHLEFALKYDGVNLGYLSLIFNVTSKSDIVHYIQSKPTGKYARRIWFLFEFLTGSVLPIADLTKGNYTEVLEPERYYTLNPGKRIQRQRVINNLLGGRDFCPIIRRSKKLQEMESINFRERCEEIVTTYPPELIRRALSYLYNKETKSSFAIEHIKPSASRTEKFVSLLELAEHQDFCKKELLIDLQNRIVDPRFKDMDYRTTQNYIGQTISYQNEMVHYVCPGPDELPQLMAGLLLAHQEMQKSNVSPIIHAALIAYGFVFLHPFEDGNGRIHRFLIHNILSIQGVVPKGLMFPVSAVMLKNPDAYDNSLEAFSHPLMKFVEYSLDDIGQITVHNDVHYYYQYIDMTTQAEYLYDFVKLTVEDELIEEMNFLANYDHTKKAIQKIVDMPDRLIDLFIRLCLQNHGHLSDRKRSRYFNFLTDDEVLLIEKVVRLGYQKN